MKKVVSFCLFGNKPIYCVGLIENLKLMSEIYPNWIARVYYSNDVPEKYINESKKYNCELLILHAQAQFHRNVSIPKTIKIPPGGYINQNLHKFTVEKEIYDKYNIVIKESHPGLQLHQKIADSIVKHIEDNLI